MKFFRRGFFMLAPGNSMTVAEVKEKPNQRTNNMKKIHTTALSVALGLAGLATAPAATYNGDLLIGFTTQSGDDLIYDLGAASSLLDGQTWNLTELLTGYNLDAVNWGIIGDRNVSGARMVWSTTESGLTANPVPNTASWGVLDNAISSIYQNFNTAGAGESISIDAANQNSWNQQTIVGTLTTQYHNAYENPNVVGATTASLFSMVANGSAPTQLGSFSLDNNGVLTFSATPAPEPGVAGLLGGGALLLFAFRRQFHRQQS
jgi:hypothetical protein